MYCNEVMELVLFLRNSVSGKMFLAINLGVGKSEHNFGLRYMQKY